MEHWGLFTDYYELTMASALHAEGREEQATFELFVRRLPPEREFLVACGLATALDRLAAFTFGPAELAYLRATTGLGDDFLAYLAGFRFTGEVRAMAEGELLLAQEPMLSVTAPLIEAQVVETLLLNTVGFETMVATKAARVAQAAAGRPFVDFSARRDHGADAAVLAARAAYVGGAVATSMVEAGRRYGIPLSGTMAHSYVMAHEHERDAFRAYLAHYREQAVLLLDTYDTVQGAREAVAAMEETGIVARGVRLDSGDLAALAREVRAVLDEAGRREVQVFASGDLDEHRVAALVAGDAPIDAFGVGTRMGTSADAPYLGVVYKLVEQDEAPRQKASPGKATYPGRKQVWRGEAEDTLALASEEGPLGARPLLAPVWRDGARVGREPALDEARERCAAGWGSWPDEGRHVLLSPGLQALLGSPAGPIEGRHQE